MLEFTSGDLYYRDDVKTAINRAKTNQPGASFSGMTLRDIMVDVKKVILKEFANKLRTSVSKISEYLSFYVHDPCHIKAEDIDKYSNTVKPSYNSFCI